MTSVKGKPALAEKENIAIREFKKRLLERLGEDLIGMKLFGSRARGRYREAASYKFFRDPQVPFLLNIEKDAVSI